VIAGAGNTEYERILRSLVADAKIGNRVHFLGFRDDVSTLMAGASAIIVASRFEGFGFVTAEAMYNGCLVIGRTRVEQRSNLTMGLKCGSEKLEYVMRTAWNL